MAPTSFTGLSRTERKELGKAARATTPIAAQAKFSAQGRQSSVIDVLRESNSGRDKDLIAIRHSRMLASPFNFYRGLASLMAADLSRSPNSCVRVQACGDCHIHNFGAFATPERKIVIDINDFDETLPAPWEWDVKRLGASLVLASVCAGFGTELGLEAARSMARRYRKHMDELSQMSHLDVWYSHVEVSSMLKTLKQPQSKQRQKQVDEAVAKSQTDVLMQKLTETTPSGEIRFKEMPPHLYHRSGVGAGDSEREAFAQYVSSVSEERQTLLNRYRLVDVAQKVVGVGSVGTTCGVILLSAGDDDFLVLQMKEARPSVLEPYAGPSRYSHHGQRVVAGQKLMQSASDMFLGWLTANRKPYRHFFVRHLRDVKIGVNTAIWTKADFTMIPAITGEILARAHARSGDPVVLRSYIGKGDEFDEAITAYSGAYAKQTERDYVTFEKACKNGTLPTVQT